MTPPTTLDQSIATNDSSVENHKKIAAHLIAANKYLEVTPVAKDGNSVADDKILAEPENVGDPFKQQTKGRLEI